MLREAHFCIAYSTLTCQTCPTQPLPRFKALRPVTNYVSVTLPEVFKL